MASIEDSGKPPRDGLRYYRVTWWTDGRESHRERYPLGWLTKEEAKDWRERLQAAERLGLDVRTLLAPASPAPSASLPEPKPVQTLADWWGANDKAQSRLNLHLSARGLSTSERGIVQAARKIVLALHGDVPVAEVTMRHGEMLVCELVIRKLARATQAKYLGWWHTALELAVGDRELAALPRVTLPRERGQRARRPFHSEEESARLLVAAAALAAEDPRTHASYLAILLGVQLGLRPGEARTRRWSDLDHVQHTLRVDEVELAEGEVWHPKTGASYRTVPLPPEVYAVLRDEWVRVGQPDTGWICPSLRRDGPLTSCQVALAAACQRAGVPVISPHCLRHSAATRWRRQSSAPEVAAALGHADVRQVEERYAHPEPARALAVIRQGAVSPQRVPPASDGPAVREGEK